MSYKKSNWVPYDPTLSFEQNVTQGGTTTADKLNNMETGIGNAFDKTSDSVGGRNLLPGTSGTLQTVTNASGWNTNLPAITPVVTTIDNDTIYTARAWISPSPASNHVNIQIVWQDSSGNTRYGGGNFISAGTSGYSTWTGTITAGSTIQRVAIVFYPQQSTPSSVSYKEMKLEQGSIATDWTPAPEDKVNVSDMRKPASDVAGIEEVNAKQDKIGYTPADDSKVVHDNHDGTIKINGNSFTPAVLDSAINENSQPINTDVDTLVKPGLYYVSRSAPNNPFNANIMLESRIQYNWNAFEEVQIAYRLLHESGIAVRYVSANGSLTGGAMGQWVFLSDDSQVAHLSGANNFDTVPTVNNKSLATTDDVATASNTVLTSANTSISKLLQSSSNNDEDSAVTNSTSDTSNFYYWTE